MPVIPNHDERKRPWFSAPEVAKAAVVNRSTVYRYIRAGLLKAKQAAPGRAVMVPRSEVRRLWGQETLDALDRAKPKGYGTRYPKPKGGDA